MPPATLATIEQAVQGADWWVPVANASWAAPEGPGTSAAAGRWDHPAVHVSRRDAAAFCGWAGGRLPTEDEWELAARGGKAARLFPWGDALTPRGEHRANIWQGAFPRGNSREDGFNWTAPVDALPPQNAFGLHHVVGNVWEWTATQWCPGGGAAAARGAVPGARRVAPGCGRRTRADLARVLADEGEVDYVKKGGSFMCHRDSCYRYRAAARDKNTANSSAANLGARCVYDARPPWAEGSDAPPQAAAAAAGGGGSKGRAGEL